MRMKNLEKFRVGGTSNHMELAIPLPKTPDGRVYRYSPNEKASPRHFVLGDVTKDFAIADEARKRMKLEPRSNQSVCPYSGMIAADAEFNHPEDVKAARKIVEHAALEDMNQAVHNLFKDLGRKHSSKFLQIETKGHHTPKPRPRFGRRDLLRELVCDHCGRDYGVFAIGLFCPDCGAPNVKLHFAREVELVSKQVDLADDLQGQQELAYRLMGNAHEDVLTAFEATLKAIYLYGVDKMGLTVKPVRNDFQNIQRTQERFADLGLDPFASLTADELIELNLNIQKRHIIGHNLGVMDEKFADQAANARVGETIHLVGEDIRRFGAIAQKVVGVLDDWLVTGTATGIVVTPVAIPASDVKDEENTMSDLPLSELAIKVGKWIAETSKDGQTHADVGGLEAAFPDASMAQLGEAVAELATDGYVETTHTIGHHLPYIAPTLELYATFDPILKIGNPAEDVLVLIERVLAKQDSVSVPELHKEVGWPIRRFNPALGILIGEIDEHSVSQEIQPNYPTTWFGLSAEDRVALKRYASRFAR